jgi:hypothetical protein
MNQELESALANMREEAKKPRSIQDLKDSHQYSVPWQSLDEIIPMDTILDRYEAAIRELAQRLVETNVSIYADDDRLRISRKLNEKALEFVATEMLKGGTCGWCIDQLNQSTAAYRAKYGNGG